MKKKAFPLMLLGVALTGCAANKVPVAELARPEVVIDTLPAGARVSENGVERGTTPLVFRAGDGQGKHSLTFAQPGFHPHLMALDDAEIAANNGQRLLLPMRPDAFEPGSKPIAADDVGQLARAGSVLSRANRCAEALLFYGQALQIDARIPAAHKGMGICYAKLNRRRQAIEAYKLYLLNAPPDAPDAAKVQAIVSRAEGDIDIPPPNQGD